MKKKAQIEDFIVFILVVIIVFVGIIMSIEDNYNIENKKESICNKLSENGYIVKYENKTCSVLTNSGIYVDYEKFVVSTCAVIR